MAEGKRDRKKSYAGEEESDSTQVFLLKSAKPLISEEDFSRHPKKKQFAREKGTVFERKKNRRFGAAKPESLPGKKRVILYRNPNILDSLRERAVADAREG